MKKIIILTLVVLVTAINSWAQECTTMWPYIYKEFQEGTLYMVGGKQYTHQFNVHVKDSRLHYVEKGIIKETRSEDIVLVKIGSDIYMNVDGRVMKVIGSDERGFVATLILGDFDKLNSSAGAYGGSSNSSATTKLSSVAIGGITIVNHMELRENRDNGQTLPLTYKYYIVTKGKVYAATKRGINSQLTESEAAEFKAFLKNHKIKWNDPQSLMTILDFFNK
ncbi:MAG: hypothetical protein F9K37_04800 [Bacteroidales bacterium]|nr:MAG: hypothetical protein F9K37_04800 [Bacteroidales bacterium]